jgi:hypothetical protein
MFNLSTEKNHRGEGLATFWYNTLIQADLLIIIHIACKKQTLIFTKMVMKVEVYY